MTDIFRRSEKKNSKMLSNLSLFIVFCLFWQMNYTQTMSVRSWRESQTIAVELHLMNSETA